MAMMREQTTLLLVLLVSATRSSLAQQSNNTSYHSKTAGGFTPTTIVVLVVLVSSLAILTLFSIYIHRFAQAHALRRRPFFRPAPQTVDAGAAHSDDQCRFRGLDRELVEAFPTAVYGDVKAHMATKSGPLECAVCLTEFADSDELRILPACCHVFHPDCIDPWLAGAVTCPLCRADLTVPPALPSAESCDLLTGLQETAQEESDEPDEARSAVTFTPESLSSFSTIWRHEFTGPENYHYRRTQSAMDAPDRHTLRLPEHVMKELAAVRRHRRAASLAEYPDAVERTPRWLTVLFRSMSWQRHSRPDLDAEAGEEHGGCKRIYPVTGAPAERPSGSGSSGNEKESSDVDTLNRV